MIIINKEPLKFLPAGNPSIFSLSANTQPLFYRVEVIQAGTNFSIFNSTVTPTPFLDTVSNFNLSHQLSSLVTYDVDNSNDLAVLKDKEMIGYYLSIKDYGLTGTSKSIAELSSGLTSNIYYVWDAQADVLNYSTTNFYDKYVFKGGSTQASFLTYQPNYKSVNDYSFEQLYFIKEANTNFDLEVTTKNGSTTYPITATSSSTTIITTTPETRAKASVIITGTTTHIGDNIGLFVNGNLLGSYSTPSTAFTQNQLATGLFNSLTANTSGYTCALSANTIDLLAPIGAGASANTFTLTTALISTGNTSNIITASTRAVVVLSGYSLPTIGSVTTIDTSDPFFGGLLLANYTVAAGDTTLSNYSTNLVSAINSNAYGYVAAQTGASRISITGRTGTGADLNGLYAYYDNQETGDFVLGQFAGGISTGTGSTTTTYSIIPNRLIGFSGGVDASSASTSTNTPAIVRLQVSPKKLGLTLANNDIYTIALKSGGTQVSETKIYKYNDLICGTLAINVVYVNSLGGVDSIQLYNPKFNLNVTKQSIKKNALNIYSDTPFKTGDRYNASDVTINSDSKVTFKANTQQFIQDDTSSYLVELIKSKAIYVELPNGDLLPVQLKDSTFNIQRQRITKEPVLYTFEFSLDENYLPMLSTGIIIND